MRAVRFVKRLQWELPGTVFRHGLTIGDVDNDGDNELVVGTAEGDLYIFKGLEIWQKITGLGLITCVAVGDIFNYGCNALVVICGDGWAHIFYSPRSVNPSNSSLPPINLPAVKKDILARDASKFGTSSPVIESNSNATENNELSGKMECVHLQRIPTNTKVVLVADVDQDGFNEMIIGLTDRVVRSYRWSTNTDLGTGKLVGLNKWECANQIGTVTLQHMRDGSPTLLVAQPGGTFMRIKCNPDDCHDEDSSEKSSEAAASCVDYQTLGISRMRNPNISTEIIGDLEPGECHLGSPSNDRHPKFVAKVASSVEHGFLDDCQLASKNFKTGSLEFRRNYSQPDMRKSSLDGSFYDRRRSETHSRDTPARFYSRVNSPEIDQVDGNLLGGNVILGDFETDLNKKSYFPSYEDFSRNNKKLEEEEEEEEEGAESEKKTEDMTEVGEREEEKSSGEGKPYALATLDGTIMLVKDEIILWAMQVDHQIFALCRLDVTGDGADEIVACTWDGQTYILDQQRRSVRFQFEEPVRAFCTGKYSVKPGTSTPCLVYNTFSNKIFLYHDVLLPSMVISPLNPLEGLESEERKLVEEMIASDTEAEREEKLRQLTEWLLYGLHT